MLTWQAADGIGLEGVRLLLQNTGGLRALGRLVRPDFTASYRLIVGEGGVLHRVSIVSATGDRERHLTLNRSEEGRWLADSGSGQSGISGADIDVDLAHSALFNSLPIRRLGLHRGAGEATVTMVHVSLPDLAVSLVEQRYRTVSTLDEDGRALVEFAWDDFRAELVVDADGVVVSYPGVATRLATPVIAPAAG